MSEKKEKLLEEVKQIEVAIAEEVDEIQEVFWRKVKIGATMALVGVGTYWVLNRFLNHPVKVQDLIETSPIEPQTEATPHHQVAYQEPTSDIIEMIKKEIAIFLLAIAKQKIHELLQKFYATQVAENQEDDGE
jgi:hypothetical protein